MSSKKSLFVVAALAVFAAAAAAGPSPALAQTDTTPKAATKPAARPAAKPPAAPASTPVPAPGPRNTFGWGMMSPEERAEHMTRMRGMSSYEDCAAYRDEHHRLMAERAQARGGRMPANPRRDMCAGLPRK